jgi:orotidine-5'-phosphate decarboxylase
MATIIIALDLPDSRAALRLVDRIGERADHYKIGAQLFTRAGPDVVRELRDRGKRVFLDLKFHDIPNAVAGAVESAAGLGVDMLTLHAAGGGAMMRAARDAAGEGGPLLVGVTVLTSLGATDVEEIWDKQLRSLREEVTRLAALAHDAGMDGVVASAREAEPLKRRFGTYFLVVTPGIRPHGTEAGDQSSTATPADAAKAGADYLVVGRPITTAPDPAAPPPPRRAAVAAPRGGSPSSAAP